MKLEVIVWAYFNHSCSYFHLILDGSTSQNVKKEQNLLLKMNIMCKAQLLPGSGNTVCHTVLHCGQYAPSSLVRYPMLM